MLIGRLIFPQMASWPFPEPDVPGPLQLLGPCEVVQRVRLGHVGVAGHVAVLEVRRQLAPKGKMPDVL